MPVTDPDLRVTFLTHYFPPEVGPAQVRLFELAKRLIAAGKAVTVVTGFPNYPTGVIEPGYRGKLFMEDLVDGIRVLRTWVYATRGRGFLSRLLNYLSFPVFSLLAIRTLGRTDVIYVQSPPLFTGLAALWFSRLKRRSNWACCETGSRSDWRRCSSSTSIEEPRESRWPRRAYWRGWWPAASRERSSFCSPTASTPPRIRWMRRTWSWHAAWDSTATRSSSTRGCTAWLKAWTSSSRPPSSPTTRRSCTCSPAMAPRRPRWSQKPRRRGSRTSASCPFN